MQKPQPPSQAPSHEMRAPSHEMRAPSHGTHVVSELQDTARILGETLDLVERHRTRIEALEKKVANLEYDASSTRTFISRLKRAAAGTAPSHEPQQEEEEEEQEEEKDEEEKDEDDEDSDEAWGDWRSSSAKRSRKF